MDEKLYLDWEGLLLYTQQMNEKIGEVTDSIKDGEITFTKNNEEIQSFSANQNNNVTLEVFNDLDVLNIIRYGESDISNYSSGKLEEMELEMVNNSAFSTVAKTGSYSDLTDTPTKLSQFENDSRFLTQQSLSNYYTTSLINDKIGNLNEIFSWSPESSTVASAIRNSNVFVAFAQKIADVVLRKEGAKILTIGGETIELDNEFFNINGDATTNVTDTLSSSNYSDDVYPFVAGFIYDYIKKYFRKEFVETSNHITYGTGSELDSTKLIDSLFIK